MQIVRSIGKSYKWSVYCWRLQIESTLLEIFIRAGEGMWLLELQLDCEFEIKWNMFVGIIHVENGTCTLGMVEEEVYVS